MRRDHHTIAVSEQRLYIYSRRYFRVQTHTYAYTLSHTTNTYKLTLSHVNSDRNTRIHLHNHADRIADAERAAIRHSDAAIFLR